MNMNESAKILVDYNNKAKKLFFSLYEKFRLSAKKLDRTKDNNVFKQQESKYLATLKHQLELVAQEFLTKSRSSGNSQLTKRLTDEIAKYVNEFRQKSRSL